MLTEILDLTVFGPASSVAAGWLADEVLLRWVTVPRLYRQRFSEYEVLSRKEVERQRIESESAAATMAAMQKEIAAQRDELERMQLHARRLEDAKKPPKPDKTAIGAHLKRAGFPAVHYSDEIVHTLIDKRNYVHEQHQQIHTKVAAILALAHQEGRRTLTEKEDSLYRDYHQKMKLYADEINNLDERITQVCEEIERAQAAKQHAAGLQKKATLTWGGELVNTLQEQLFGPAVGAVGAVTDPLRQWEKFNTPSLYDHLQMISRALTSKYATAKLNYGGHVDAAGQLPRLAQCDVGQYFTVASEPGAVYVWDGHAYEHAAIDNSAQTEIAKTDYVMKLFHAGVINGHEAIALTSHDANGIAYAQTPEANFYVDRVEPQLRRQLDLRYSHDDAV